MKKSEQREKPKLPIPPVKKSEPVSTPLAAKQPERAPTPETKPKILEKQIPPTEKQTEVPKTSPTAVQKVPDLEEAARYLPVPPTPTTSSELFESLETLKNHPKSNLINFL